MPIPRIQIALFALLAFAPLAMRAQTVVVTRGSIDQVRQLESERASRAAMEQKRQEALAIALRDQALDRAKTQANRDQVARDFGELGRQKTAEAQALAQKIESDRLRNNALEQSRAVAEVNNAARIRHEDDVVDIRREARRHVRAAALADVKAGRIDRAEAARRMLYSTPQREAVADDFAAGRIDKSTALSLLSADDKGATPPSTARTRANVSPAPLSTSAK